MLRTIGMLLVVLSVGCEQAQGPTGVGSDGGNLVGGAGGGDGGVTSPQTVIWADADGKFVSGGATPIIFDQHGYVWQADTETGVLTGLYPGQYTGVPVYADSDCTGTPIGVVAAELIPPVRAVFPVENGISGNQATYAEMVRSDHSVLIKVAGSSEGVVGACSEVAMAGEQRMLNWSDLTAVTPPTTSIVGPLHQEQQ